MCLLKERLKVILEKRNSPRVNQILHRVDILILISINLNHLHSHLRVIMALDHSRLLLEFNSGQIFAYEKITLQNLANKSAGV